MVRAYRLHQQRHAAAADRCLHCGGGHEFETLDPEVYAYLLGVYLGDGWLAARTHHFQLRIACDDAYPILMDEIGKAIEVLRGRLPGRFRPDPASGCTYLSSGWKQWGCHFPQHGPGRKHDRVIELAPWQRALVDRAPKAFLRGLIHSDGCRTLNCFQTKLPSGRIATRSNHRNISIAHRRSVAHLDGFVGPKA